MKTRLLFFLLLFASIAQAQNRPKLVVGIMVDQMRWDYLYRFYNRYEAGGFKRLLNQGFSCENTFIPYTPTHTAAGHACAYTGSVPALNGIIGNSWYSKELGRTVYCTEDSTVAGVGSNTAVDGKMSPRNLWATTITDELRISTNYKSKTVAFALKDRGSILPGGHTANGAYWFENASGGWITSTHYMQQLPEWLVKLNNKKLPDVYMKQSWNTLYPINTYEQSTADAKAYENKFPGEDNTFPHRTDSITANRYEAFRTTPFANTYTVEAAKAAIEGERLGARGVTDFLALSFSSPDYVGHTFGPNSIELEDTYLRLDKDMASLLNYLDTKVGKGQYLVFLSADHAVAHSTGYLAENKFPTRVTSSSSLLRAANEALKQEFGDGKFILTMTNYQVYLNTDFIISKKHSLAAVKEIIIRSMQKQPGIFKVVDLENVASATLPAPVKMALTNGFNQRLSGDLQYLYMPFVSSWEKGASHGLWNPYDSHIPLIWFGWNIKPGKTNRDVYMTDIAPTLAALLKIQVPNASIGKVIEEVVPVR